MRRSTHCNRTKGVPGSDVFGLQPSCLEPCSRVDHFIHEGRAYSTRSDSQRRTVVQRRAFPFALIQGEALSHAMQFAQRLRDIADEELVTPLENFVAAACREPDSAEEHDRADEAAEAEVMKKHHRPHSNRPAAALPKCYRFNQVCGIDTMEVRNPLDRENPIRISHVVCHGTRYHQGARRT